MAIVRWDPFRELSEMQDRMNRLFGEYYGRRGEDDVMSRGTWWPPVDIYENDKQELVIKAELPDMKKDDITLTVDNNVLTISGEKQIRHGDEGRAAATASSGRSASSAGRSRCRRRLTPSKVSRRVQERRPDRHAAEAGRSEAEADRRQGQRLIEQDIAGCPHTGPHKSAGTETVPAAYHVPHTTHFRGRHIHERSAIARPHSGQAPRGGRAARRRASSSPTRRRKSPSRARWSPPGRAASPTRARSCRST